MENSRKYEFDWKLIGDLRAGRPNLGWTTRVEVYRLMQASFRDVMEVELGIEKTDGLFYAAGQLAGREFYKQFLSHSQDFNTFVKELQGLLREYSIGIFRIEKADLELDEVVIALSEDLECSGLPEMGYETCVYDEGFFSAILECFSGRKFSVKEVDCWTTGDRTCRFVANAI